MIASSSTVYTSILFGIVLASFRYNYHIGNVKFSCIEGKFLWKNEFDEGNSSVK